MQKAEYQFTGLNDEDIIKVLNLLGADFGDDGKIKEISFFDSNCARVRIVDANFTGHENESDIKSSMISDCRDEINNNM